MRHWAAGVAAAVAIGVLSRGPARGLELTAGGRPLDADRLARAARDRARQPLEPERAGARAALAARRATALLGPPRLRGGDQHPARRAGDRADEGRHLQLPRRVPERVAVGPVRGCVRRPHRSTRSTCALGMQKFAWGKLDRFQPTDVLNVERYSDPFLLDEDERKIAVPAIQASYSLPRRDWIPEESRLTLVWIPQYFPYRFPLLGERWFPPAAVPPSSFTVPPLIDPIPVGFRLNNTSPPSFQHGRTPATPRAPPASPAGSTTRSATTTASIARRPSCSPPRPPASRCRVPPFVSNVTATTHALARLPHHRPGGRRRGLRLGRLHRSASRRHSSTAGRSPQHPRPRQRPGPARAGDRAGRLAEIAAGNSPVPVAAAAIVRRAQRRRVGPRRRLHLAGLPAAPAGEPDRHPAQRRRPADQERRHRAGRQPAQGLLARRPHRAAHRHAGAGERLHAAHAAHHLSLLGALRGARRLPVHRRPRRTPSSASTRTTTRRSSGCAISSERRIRAGPCRQRL